MQIMAVYNCFCCLNPPKWPLISWVSIFQLCGSSDGQTILLLVWSSMCLKSIYIYIIQYVHCMSCVYIYIHTLYTYTYTYVQVRASKVFANAESFLPAADGWTWARCWPTAPWARWCGSQWASLAVGTRATRDLEVLKTGWKDQEHVDFSQG